MTTRPRFQLHHLGDLETVWFGLEIDTSVHDLTLWFGKYGLCVRYRSLPS